MENLGARGRARGVASHPPGSKFACTGASYSFPSRTPLARLYFPPSGIVHTGKTLWIHEVYHLLTPSNVPAPVAFESDSSTREGRTKKKVEE